MKHIIIGTAGHIDHGKTSLIEAMTGYNGDESEQERQRGITTSLSFCNMQQNGINISFIDVPGHEKLIKNMVSGAFGFDAALFVVDAKEGIMPQTIEHIKILKLLEIKRLIVAVTKCDLVDDEVSKREISNITKFIGRYSYFDIQAVVPTSIYDKKSIEKLKDTLFQTPKKESKNYPFFRCYIDRVFSLKGIGTVVTGTLLSGEIYKKEKINIAQLNRVVTVKNIQIHSQDTDIAHAHQRVALNLDISYNKLKKGYLLCSKGYLRGFDTIDVSIKSIDNRLPPHNSQILFITGSMVVEGKILYYEDKNYASIKLKDKIFSIFEDKFIILQNGRLKAGGKIVIPISEPLRKSVKLSLLKALDRRDFKNAFEILLQNHKRGFGLISAPQRFNMSHQEAIKIAKDIKDSFLDEKELVLYSIEAIAKLEESIKSIYQNNPKALLSSNSINMIIKWASVSLIEYILNRLADSGYIQKQKNIFVKSDQDVENLLDTAHNQIYQTLQNGGMTPKAPNDIYKDLDIDKKIGDNILRALLSLKRVIKLSSNIFVTTQNLQKAIYIMKNIVQEDGYIDIRNFKSKTQMSRKYCIAYLEYFDSFEEVYKKKDKRFLRREGGGIEPPLR